MVTAAQQTELDKAVRSPRGLLKVVHATGTILICTGGNVTWNSMSFVKGGVSIKTVKTGKGGIQTARITLINEDYIYSILAISGDLALQEVTYWEYYGQSPALEDPILRFHGEIVKIPTMGQTVVLDCATIGSTTKKIPTVTLGSPEVNHMPRSGEQITIGNEVYTIEVN
jgi:hypothetical protein